MQFPFSSSHGQYNLPLGWTHLAHMVQTLSHWYNFCYHRPQQLGCIAFHVCEVSAHRVGMLPLLPLTTTKNRVGGKKYFSQSTKREFLNSPKVHHICNFTKKSSTIKALFEGYLRWSVSHKSFHFVCLINFNDMVQHSYTYELGTSKYIMAAIICQNR